jgi:capsular polysaccharide biosynthesis protein
MKHILYQALKNIADRAVQALNQHLPWQPTGREELLPAGAPYCPVPPRNSDQLPPKLAALFREEILLPAVHIFQVLQASVSWHAVAFRNLRIFVPALAHPRELRKFSDTYLLKQWVGESIQGPGNRQEVALVHNQWTNANYYHWLVDSLPRLLLLQHGHPNCQLVMPAPIPSFVREAAAMLGFTNLLPLQQNQTLVGVDLLVPGHVTPPGFQRPDLLLQVRAQLLNAVYKGASLPRTYRRVYVSRRSQRVRRLLNEIDIEILLVQQGYELIEFEKLSFIEQIKLMSETERFISVHGAGLTNMLFLPPTARVAELFNEDKVLSNQPKDFENLIYFRMAAALQLPYYCLPCAATGDEPLVNEAHIRVDVAAFEQMLRRMDE